MDILIGVLVFLSSVLAVMLCLVFKQYRFFQRECDLLLEDKRKMQTRHERELAGVQKQCITDTAILYAMHHLSHATNCPDPQKWRKIADRFGARVLRVPPPEDPMSSVYQEALMVAGARMDDADDPKNAYPLSDVERAARHKMLNILGELASSNAAPPPIPFSLR